MKMSSLRKKNIAVSALLLISSIPYIINANSIGKQNLFPSITGKPEQDGVYQEQTTRELGPPLGNHRNPLIGSLDLDDFHSNIDLDNLIQYSPRYSMPDETIHETWLEKLSKLNPEEPRLDSYPASSISSQATRFTPSGDLSKRSNGLDKDHSAPLAKVARFVIRDKQHQIMDGLGGGYGNYASDAHHQGSPFPLTNQDHVPKASLWTPDLIADLLSKQRRRAQPKR